MNRPILACAFFALAATALGAQDASQSSPLQGTSNPPMDDVIITTEAPPAKPPAGHPMEQATPAPARYGEQPVYQTNSASSYGTTPSNSGPTLSTRIAVDPDSDMVHPEPLPPGTLGEGTMIRVRLLNSISSSLSERGEAFRSRVATDVLQGGQVLIPAGSEISGRISDVSTGHFGGHGSIRLQPETVTMANGASYRLHAQVGSTPGSHTNVGAEGEIKPGSQKKKDGIEYGAVVGGGMITGAMIGGPAGALAGGIVGAGVVTTHLLVSHPQANLSTGTVLILTLTEPMHLDVVGTSGN